jgi:hypothetical protein
VKYFEFTKKWLVKVSDEDDEPEARKLIATDSDKYLKSEIVTRTEYKNTKQTGGWGNGFKEQLLGANGKR